MIKGENIICISKTTWYGEYTKSTVQILSLLARNNKVLFVEYHYTIKDILTTLLGKQDAPILRMLGIKKRLQIIDTDKNSQVYHLVLPPFLPVDFIKWDKLFFPLFKLNVFIYKATARKWLKKLGMESPISISAYNPFYGLYLMNQLNEKLNVYYCYDGIDVGRHGKRIYSIEKEFSQKADIIITSSDHLYSGKKKINPNSYVVKNGVDYPSFKKFSKEGIPAREKKRIGYIGSLDHRFDIEVMEYAIKKLPGMFFEFTGNLRNITIKERLDKYQNVSFLPPVNKNEVPGLLATYDAGIIPYTTNEINKNIYPLKINEYLAVGVPVVMTQFASLPEFKEQVSFAQNKKDFADKIIFEVNNDNQDKISKRIQFAASNSWENRTKDFSNIISNAFKNEY